ncbi:hypothetical protein BDV32DRAFT_116231 [Aspergillus pseudonomiae]|nr:hypothetical protein BDV32DRAFT_116231 [Aspergillus pseudonomiae]
MQDSYLAVHFVTNGGPPVSVKAPPRRIFEARDVIFPVAERTELVKEICERLDCFAIVRINGTPASGKTTLINFTIKHLIEDPWTVFMDIYLSMKLRSHMLIGSYGLDYSRLSDHFRSVRSCFSHDMATLIGYLKDPIMRGSQKPR